MREDVRKGVYVENLTEVEVNSVQDVIELLSQVTPTTPSQKLLREDVESSFWTQGEPCSFGSTVGCSRDLLTGRWQRPI